MELFLEYYVLAAVFVFGAIIGSFLNVVIYRFHTGKSLNGSSHCLSCLQPLLWYELFPLFSYLVLKGRCRSCASYIPPRYFVVELLTALGFVSVYIQGGSLVTMFFLGAILAILIIVTVYDIYHLVIPNELVIVLSMMVAAWYGLQVYEGLPLTELTVPTLAAAGAFAFYGGLWKVSRGRWIGFGDAKLAVPLGFLAGFPGVFSMVVLSFWVGALFSLVFLGIQAVAKRGQVPLRFFGTELTMKSEIPFAPFLIVGFVLSTFYGVDVLTLIGYVFK